MSESIRDQWPSASAQLSEHMANMEQALDVVRNELVLPEDPRYEIAYASLLTAGGAEGSVSVMGEPGTGKTSFGDMLFTEANRVEIRAKDSDATLYGHRNPIDPNQWVPGRLIGLGDNAYLNEGPHLRNTGPLHPLWDSESVQVDGQDISLKNVAIYLTGNFPDSERNHPYDSAFRSRHGMEMLSGDHDIAAAVQIQQRGAKRTKDSARYPILPSTEVRGAISDELDRRYSVGSEVGSYIVQVVESLNASGLTEHINRGDARIGRSWNKIARAGMLVNPRIDRASGDVRTRIAPHDYAVVAGLVLPTLVTLSRTAKQLLQEEAGGRRTTPFEQAVGVRRVIARTAFDTLSEEGGPKTSGSSLDRLADKYSYANPASVNFDIDRALFRAQSQATVTNGSNNDKRQLRRRR